MGAGDIVAVMGLKQTTTGETLCDDKNPVILESMDFPAPVIQVAIEPKSKGDQEKLGVAIQRLAEEDPSFQVHSDEETGQTIIGGMGELHLEVLVDRMKREFQRRGQRRQAAGRVPRDDPQDRRAHRLHAQEADRWYRPVREGADRDRAHRGRRRVVRVREQGHRWPHPPGVHPVGGRGCAGSHAVRHPGRLRDGRASASPFSTVATTRSTPRSSPSRSPVRRRSRRPRARRPPCSSSR